MGSACEFANAFTNFLYELSLDSLDLSCRCETYVAAAAIAVTCVIQNPLIGVSDRFYLRLIVLCTILVHACKLARPRVAAGFECRTLNRSYVLTDVLRRCPKLRRFC